MNEHKDLTTEEMALAAQRLYQRGYKERNRERMLRKRREYWARRFEKLSPEEQAEALKNYKTIEGAN